MQSSKCLVVLFLILSLGPAFCALFHRCCSAEVVKPDLNSHAPTFCREILDSLTFSGQLWDRDQNVVPRRGVKRSCPLRKSPIEWCYDRMPPRYRNINGAPSGVGPLVLVAGDRNTPP